MAPIVARSSVEEATVGLARRAGATMGALLGAPRWARMSRTVVGAVMKAMIRIAPTHLGHRTCSRPQFADESDRRPHRRRLQAGLRCSRGP
jgi:hypothetical protein